MTNEIRELREKLRQLEEKQKIEELEKKKFSGTLNIRISPLLHKSLVYLALKSEISLNSIIAKNLEKTVRDQRGLDLIQKMQEWKDEGSGDK